MADIAVQAALQILTPFIVDVTLSSFDALKLRSDDLKSDLSSIEGTLELLKGYVAKSDKAGRTPGTELSPSSIVRIRDLAYRIEDVLEEFKLHSPDHFHQYYLSRFAHKMRYEVVGHRRAFSELSSKIKSIKVEVEESRKLIKDLGGVHPTSSATAATSIHGQNSRFGPKHKTALIATKEGIIKELLSEKLQVFTVSIVGPSGSGKTVLAWDVYEDPRVQESFEFRAWLDVSSSLDEEKLLMGIVVQFWRNQGDIELSHHEVARIRQLRDRLTRDLKNKRFLVVLDNIKSEWEWSFLKNALLSGHQGSNIIITSSNEGVGSSCSGGSGSLLRIEGLPCKDSYNLFSQQVFRSNEGECPEELEDWAMKIIKKCEGQPRALITVACELSKKPMRPAEWEEFHDTLGRNYPLMTRLWPSFEDLGIRSDLKSCFFYFSVFPEDYSINAEKLKRLWIAEGFFDGVREETDKEKTAGQYLEELVGLNLVHVSMTDLDGRPKTCRVLNLVREIIIAEAEKQTFVEVIGRRSSSVRTTKARRLSLTADRTTNCPTENAHHIRSAFLFGKDSSFNLDKFKLMRVLEMKGACGGSFPKGILKLHLLRYLSLRNTRIRDIPREIKKLSLLETLDLKHTLVTELPRSICKLRKLRHLLVSYYDDSVNDGASGLGKGVVMNGKVGALANLQKLYMIRVDKKIIKELSKLVHLRKLGIVGLKQRDVKEFCESLQKLRELKSLHIEADPNEARLDLERMPGEFNDALKGLDRLYLKGWLEKLPKWISDLNSVIKISLRCSMLLYSPLGALQDLPNLMELELIEAYTGDSLVFTRNSFKRLKVLTMEGLDNLNKVEVQQEAMPKLERLQISKCRRMVTQPQGIRNLGNLREPFLPDMR